MNEARANRILAALKEQGVDQMLITDPMSICYLTGISMAPIERFYALLLKADGHHYYFLNHLFNVPGDVGVEKVWYSDTDPVPEIVAARLDKNAVLKGTFPSSSYGNEGRCRLRKRLSGR